MSKPRRPHTDEVTRRAVVREIQAGELTVAQAALRLRVSRQSVYRWMVRAAPASPRSGFVALDLLPAAPTSVPIAEISLRGGRILRVPLDVEPGALSRLVQVLEVTC
jgi:hypothetical protein